MPELALAPSAPSPVSTSAVAGNAATLDGADDAVQDSPFASVLQEQLAAQILLPMPEFVGLPAAEPAADAPTDAAADTVLPMLLEIAGQSAAAAIAAPVIAAPVIAAPVIAASVTVNTPTATPLPPLANAPMGTTTQKLGASDTALPLAAATSGSKSTAILAASAADDEGARFAAVAAKADQALTAVAADTPAPRAEAQQQLHATQMRPPEQAARIDASVGTRQWDGEFANRVSWMVSRQEQRADLVLNPPQLGRIEVSLSVSGDQATAIFTSASATVRDAIENALPRLREALLESGINLGQTQVGAESQQQSPSREENGDNRDKAMAAGHDTRALPAGFGANSTTAWLSGGRGIVDVFA